MINLLIISLAICSGPLFASSSVSTWFKVSWRTSILSRSESHSFWSDTNFYLCISTTWLSWLSNFSLADSTSCSISRLNSWYFISYSFAMTLVSCRAFWLIFYLSYATQAATELSISVIKVIIPSLSDLSSSISDTF